MVSLVSIRAPLPEVPTRRGPATGPGRTPRMTAEPARGVKRVLCYAQASYDRGLTMERAGCLSIEGQTLATRLDHGPCVLLIRNDTLHCQLAPFRVRGVLDGSTVSLRVVTYRVP